MKIKSVYVLSIIVCVLFAMLAVLAFILFKSHGNNSNINLYSTVPEINSEVKDYMSLDRSLNDQKIIDDENVKSVEIRIVPDISEPIITQTDSNGNEIISSKYTIDDKNTAIIEISPKEFIFGLPDTEKEIWIDAQFWSISELIMRKNTKTLRKIDRIPAISVKSNK